MDESPQPRAAEVESLTDEIAIVTVRGEHDVGTKSELEDALARAGLRRHVLVDPRTAISWIQRCWPSY